MADAPLLATAPETHATVHASAGTGKTWLLVTRMVRLLLAGAKPGNLLAVTFTRKAAAEMQQRLSERLADFTRADDAQLDAMLEQIGEQPSAALRVQARRLYDQLMFTEQRPRTTTFHAFCQEILERFPLEANIPPGFELLESEAQYRELAWAALYAEATQQPDAELAQHLERLYDLCNGLHNTHLALNQFLAQRIDWWAYTLDKKYPARWAAAVLKEQLVIDPEQDPSANFFTADLLEQTGTFAHLLSQHDTKSNRECSAAASDALDDALPLESRIASLTSALFTKDGKRRARTLTKTLINKLGADQADTLLALHEQLCDAVELLQEQQNRLTTHQLNFSWFHAGERLVAHYQRIKQEQRLLDFADLEWKAYQLLNQAQQAHWVQYKLDARIDHLLIDEFQDTNPTQWRLLLPLLEELAAGTDDRARSVFLVGDAKQSIYRFRRADARLLDHAADWLYQHLQAQHTAMNRSRRSSQAVIDCVNAVFQSADHPLIPDFPEHTTFHDNLWGEVALLPLIDTADEDTEEPAYSGFRNPLLHPRQIIEDQRYYHEGCLIADKIHSLIQQKTIVFSGNDARALEYRDILILLRNRTHAPHYERALRDASIPYLGTAKGTLLESIEARDLEALLNTLITPHNNLALAQVLRCPLFACRDEDLILLAQTPGKDWMERLLTLGPTLPETHPLARANKLLNDWNTWAGVLPVHDLLDRIFYEGDLLRRYLAATPATLQPRVQANLLRMLELALEIDSGRYPSLPRFIHALQSLRDQADDAPDDAAPSSGSNRVQFMTVHGAKGLEAPVVFLADASSVPRDRSAWSALVDWPAARARPSSFFLLADRKRRDAISDAHKSAQDEAAAREDANLLYVALTRARQCLYISGTQPARSKQLGWYGLIEAALPEGYLQSGKQPQHINVQAQPEITQATPDLRLQRPIKIVPQQQRIAPSRQIDYIEQDAHHDPDACERGIAIHRFLELLGEPAALSEQTVLHRIARELQRSTTDADLLTWLEEAQRTLAHNDCQTIFAAHPQRKSYKEVPISYQQDGVLVDGIIDRLLIDPDEITIVDFKSSQMNTADEAQQLAKLYQRQMQLYADGIRRLWPEKSLKTYLLFTHGPYLIAINV